MQKAPGSHVVVMSRGEEIPDTTKQEAAELAVIYSSTYKAGTGAKVAVSGISSPRLKTTTWLPGAFCTWTHRSLPRAVCRVSLSFWTLLRPTRISKPSVEVNRRKSAGFWRLSRCL